MNRTKTVIGICLFISAVTASLFVAGNIPAAIVCWIASFIAGWLLSPVMLNILRKGE